MESQVLNKLEIAVHDLGYATFEEFALKNVKREIQEKIVEYQELVTVYENKYGMDYLKFCDQFHSLTQWDMFEKEDDSMMWKTYLEVGEIHKKQLQKLV